MMMEHISKPFVALATKWNKDLLLRARLKLTVLYVATSALLLAVFSYILYGDLLIRLRETIDDNVFGATLQKLFFDQASDALQSQILITDGIALLVVMVIGYLLTTYTLRPIAEARKREQRFLADAAHELRMPLSVMKTGVEILLRGEKDLSLNVKKILKENIEEIDALTHIANSLLSLVGEKSKHIQLDIPVSIYDVVSSAVKKLTPLANSRQIAISIESEESLARAQVSADQSALTRTFENIIENGIKYTDKGGRVKVALSHKGDLVLVTVSDSGIGISPTDLAHVTEPFWRADKARTSNEGSGLGLAIVEETLRAHSGKLHIESELGVGTIVKVTLTLVKIT